VTALVLALALTSFAPVGREQIAEAMRASKGYDPAATTNAGRFTIEILLALADKAEREHVDKPLFVGHDEWFAAFLEARGLTAETAPLYVRLAHQYAQDMAVEYRMDHLIERVVKGPAPRRALAVTVAWPEKPGVPHEFSFEDLLSKPMLHVTNHQQIRYRVLVFDDRIVVDQIEGVTGRPLSGALAMLFKVIGEGRIVEYRMAVSPDGVQVSFGRARKALFEVSSTLTVRPDGRAEKDVPNDRPDLREIETRLEAPIEVRYRPLDLALSEAR
jgi:hypothetical protein